MAWGDSNETSILERIAVAQEGLLAEIQTMNATLSSIAGHQAAIDGHQATIMGHQASIMGHLSAIEGYQQCMCDCCRNGSIRGELLIETSLENATDPPDQRYAKYEQALSEVGAGGT